MRWLGIDIGGANLKLADGNGFAESLSFALWKQPRGLAQELRTLIAHAPVCDHLAVTMTGELADCFATKSEGVRSILEALVEASDGRHTRVYLVNGMLVTPGVAKTRPSEVAAANWHALARFAGRFAPQATALLIDVGSTTCDLIPISNGEPVAHATTDTERLICGELVYTGVERSPVCAVLDSAPFRGRPCPLAHELFASMRDVYVILNLLAESAATDLSVDGGPANKAGSRVRLARTICADAETFNHRDAVTLAEAAAQAQASILRQAVQQVLGRMASPPATCILSGHGEFLARRALEPLSLSARLVSLQKELGPRVSRCAPAHALAVLAREAT